MFLRIRRPAGSTLFPYTTLFRSRISLLRNLKFLFSRYSTWTLFIFQFNRDLFFLIETRDFFFNRTTGVIRGYLAERSNPKRIEHNDASPDSAKKRATYTGVFISWICVGYRRPETSACDVEARLRRLPLSRASSLVIPPRTICNRCSINPETLNNP